MAPFYPRKQTVIIALICAAAVAGTIIYVNRDGATPSNEDMNVIASNQDTTNTFNATTSEDWQRVFYSGTSTGAVTLKKATTTAQLPDQDTFTDTFSKNFFARFMVLQQGGAADDQQSVQSVLNQTMNDLSGAPQPTAYTMRDVKISASSGVSADQIYGNTVGTLIFTETPQQDPATIASGALDQNDQNAITEIDPIIKGYTQLLTDLKKVPVPKEMAAYHVDLLNGVSGMLFVSQGMRGVFSDPVQSLVALNMYGQAQDQFHDSLLSLKQYFINSGIQFSSTQGGSLFSTLQ